MADDIEIKGVTPCQNIPHNFQMDFCVCVQALTNFAKYF